MTAVGLNQTAVKGQGLQLVFFDLQTHQAVAVETQTDVAARPQSHRAAIGNDAAGVAHLRAQQSHATVVGRDGARVAHACGAVA